MKVGDEVEGGGWIAAVAQTLTRQAVYVSPPGEWRWDRDVKLTGVSIPAVARELEPKSKRALIHFLLLAGYGTFQVRDIAGVARPTVTKEKKRLGLALGAKPAPKTPPKERPLWWHLDQEKRRKKREEKKREQGNKE